MKHRFWLVLAASIAGILVLLLAVFTLTVYAGMFGKLPSKGDLAAIKQAQASLVYSHDGQLIGKFFSQNRTNISYENLPEQLIQALIATEDARFWEHQGIDFKSLVRVALKSVVLGQRSSGGGSTLSQQLAKNLYGRSRHGRLSMPVAKLREMIIAARLEQVYSKQELIELYLNTVPFGEDVYGIEAAAKRYFGRSAAQLDLPRSASLVGMLKANTRFNPRLHPELALERRAVVLRQMEKAGYLAADEREKAAAQPLGLQYSAPENAGPAPYLLPVIRREAQGILEKLAAAGRGSFDIETDGLIITTTLDTRLQQAGQRAFAEHLPARQAALQQQYQQPAFRKSLEKLATTQLARAQINPQTITRTVIFDGAAHQNRAMSAFDSTLRQLTQLQAGLVGLDPKSGAVRCWLGGIDYASQPNDQVLASRQLASSFKPLLYATALENQWSPCQWLSNDTADLYQGQWKPANYDHTSGGQVTLPAALRQSLNLPAVHLYRQMGHAPLQRMWEQLAFRKEFPHGEAVALGSAAASALELAVAYASLANGGFKVVPFTISRIETAEGELLYEHKPEAPQRLWSVQTTDYLTQMLQQVVDSGTAAVLRGRYQLKLPLAAKTGTSQNYGDAWFAAYSPQLVLVSRAGAPLPAVHFSSGKLGSGSALALPLQAPVWKAVQQQQLLRRLYGDAFSLEHLLPACSEKPQTDWLYELGAVLGADKDAQAQRAAKRAEKREERRDKRKNFLKKLFGNN